MVGRLTLWRLEVLYDHYSEHPPLQWMVQAYLGIKGRSRRGSARTQQGGGAAGGNDFEKFVEALLGAGAARIVEEG